MSGWVVVGDKNSFEGHPDMNSPVSHKARFTRTNSISNNESEEGQKLLASGVALKAKEIDRHDIYILYIKNIISHSTVVPRSFSIHHRTSHSQQN